MTKNITEVMIDVGDLMEQKADKEQEKKDRQRSAIQKALDQFNKENQMALSMEQYEDLKKIVAKSNKEEKPAIDELSMDIDSLEQDIRNSIAALKASMTKNEDGNYTLDLKGIGKIVYSPYPPYQLGDIDEETRINILMTIIENERWNALDFDPMEYFLLQDELAKRQKELFPNDELHLLPGIAIRTNVDKSELKITKSRKKA